MSETPLFSIVTITLNNLQSLHNTKNSVQEQDFHDYEWLVVDGGSKDGTPAYLASINADFTSERDTGIYDAMNKGLARAAGKYVIFLNAGDELAKPDVLGKIAQAIKSNPHVPDFVYGDFIEERNGEYFEKRARSHTQKILGMFTSHQSMLYRREALGDARYNMDYPLSSDYHFTCRFLQQTDNALHVPFPIGIFESGGVSQKNKTRSRNENAQIRVELGLCGPLTSQLILTRNVLGIAFHAVAPKLFLKMRNIEGVHVPAPHHEQLTPEKT